MTTLLRVVAAGIVALAAAGCTVDTRAPTPAVPVAAETAEPLTLDAFGLTSARTVITVGSSTDGRRWSAAVDTATGITAIAVADPAGRQTEVIRGTDGIWWFRGPHHTATIGDETAVGGWIRTHDPSAVLNSPSWTGLDDLAGLINSVLTARAGWSSGHAIDETGQIVELITGHIDRLAGTTEPAIVEIVAASNRIQRLVIRRDRPGGASEIRHQLDFADTGIGLDAGLHPPPRALDADPAN